MDARGSFSGLSWVYPEHLILILPKTPRSVESLGAWSSGLTPYLRQFFRLNRVDAAGSDTISGGLSARDIIARGEAPG